MGLRRYIVLLAAALLFQPGYAARALDVDSLKIYTENYPPYNYTEGAVIKGTSTEKVLKILKKLGSSLKRSDIQLQPWARSYETVQHDVNALIYSIAYSAERKKIFKWVCPIGRIKIGLIAAKADHIVIDSPKDLEKYRIGVVREDIGHQLIRKIAPTRNLDVAHSSELNMRKLQNGRIDLFAYDVGVIQFLLPMLNLDPASYETVFVLDEQDLCIGFNKDAKDELVTAFQWALDAVNAEETSGQQ